MDQDRVDLKPMDSSSFEAYLNYIIRGNINKQNIYCFIDDYFLLLLLLLMFILSSLASACKLFRAKLPSKLVDVFSKSPKESDDGIVGSIELFSTFNEHKRAKFKSNICDSTVGVNNGDGNARSVKKLVLGVGGDIGPTAAFIPCSVSI